MLSQKSAFSLRISFEGGVFLLLIDVFFVKRLRSQWIIFFSIVAKQECFGSYFSPFLALIGSCQAQ